MPPSIAPSPLFDVFLCYNSKDQPDIQEIAAQLQQQNISYWLDSEQLPPGTHWLATQDRDMSQLKSVAVFIGQHGLGKWQRIEITIFLQQFVEQDLRIIPVFLSEPPPGTELLNFLKLFTNLSGTTLDELAAQVRLWLEGQENWLLIFDNADQPELLKSVLPRRHQGKIFLTSRSQRFASLGIKKPIEMPSLSLEEAIAFLQDRTQRFDLDAAKQLAIKDLAQELGGLPLALEQAGAYLDQMEVSFAVYLRRYRQQPLELLDRQSPVTGDYPKSVTKTWLLNFEEVGRRSPLAVEILQVSAVWAADDIPEALLLRSELGLAEAEAELDELDLAGGLATLASFSLIDRERETKCYSLYRLVQEVVWHGLAVAVRQDWLRRAIAALDAVLPDVTKIENWKVCGLLVPHVQAIAFRLDTDPVDAPQLRRLLNEAGYYLKQQGRYSEAEPLYRRSLSILEKALPASHPKLAIVRENLEGLRQHMQHP